MKLLDILLIGLTIALLIIGVDQSIAYGFQNSYWAFMLALVPFFILSFRKSQKQPQNDGKQESIKSKKVEKQRKK